MQFRSVGCLYNLQVRANQISVKESFETVSSSIPGCKVHTVSGYGKHMTRFERPGGEVFDDRFAREVRHLPIPSANTTLDVRNPVLFSLFIVSTRV